MQSCAKVLVDFRNDKKKIKKKKHKREKTAPVGLVVTAPVGTKSRYKLLPLVKPTGAVPSTIYTSKAHKFYSFFETLAPLCILSFLF